MSVSKFDAVIIGGGHNGLVCAAYLARAGKRTMVIEKRDVLGGAAVTEEIAPGFKSSTFSYLIGAFYHPIYQELGLGDYLQIHTIPDIFCPIGSDDYLHTNYKDKDGELTKQSIAKFSREDAAAYDNYREMLKEISPIMQTLMMTIPPDVTKLNYATIKDLGQLLWKLRRSRNQIYRLIDIASQSANDFLSFWFKREEVRAYFAYTCSIGNFVGPSTPGSALLMLGYQAGRHEKNPQGHVKGGMGAITEALRKIGENAGVQYRVGDPVEEVLVRSGRALGVRTKSGREILSDIVVSNAHPKILFGKLVDAREVPPEFAHAVRGIRTYSSAWKINIAAEAPPRYSANIPAKTGLDNIVFSHIGPTIKYLDRAYYDAKAGWYSKKPFVSVVVPSLVDQTMAPPGKHIVHLFGGHAPYDLDDADWSEERDNFAKSVLDVVDEVAPGFSDGVIAKQVLVPQDIEAMIDLPHGNIMHGDIMLDQMFSKRPVPGYADYRTPIHGLYQCGAACHPGGGVTGIPGYNAARVILKRR